MAESSAASAVRVAAASGALARTGSLRVDLAIAHVISSGLKTAARLAHAAKRVRR
jgi:hypothetical protein